jgi:peptidoglycan lytic transglycosylase
MSPIRLSAGVIFLILWATGSAYAAMLAPEDRDAYRVAFAVARASDWTTARRIANRARERLPGKVLYWLELTHSNTATFGDLVEFADRNLDWPLQGILRERAEEASRDVPDAVLLPYFQKNRPTTPQGKLHLADMLAASGQSESAIDLVRATWLAPDLDPDTEKAILERYVASLRPEDHAARLDRLIWAGLASAAGRMLELVPEEQRILGEARLALASLQPDAQDLVSRVPQHIQRDPALLFERARWSRRMDRLEEAAGILIDAPDDLGRPAAWHAECQILARRLIDDGKDTLAYELLTRRAPSVDRADYADAEFLSGWIVFRRLNDPKAGYAHFTRLFQAVKLPITRSRGAYWAGRAAEALGMGDTSRRWFATAASYETTYYGQLAAARLREAVVPKFPPDPVPGPDEVAGFDANELVRAARMLSEIGEDEIAKPFLLHLSAAAATPADQKLIAALAIAMHRLDVGIVAATRAGLNGVPLLEPGFPVIPIPHDGAAEKALVLAIARQESGFDKFAVSRSDARGLMQLKPSTAKQVAKSLSLPFSADRLLTDANFNLMLGYTYLDKMLDSFNGSYVLSIAAYNAGPARVAQWLHDHGDPRSDAVDVLDWIELIPFGETRNYIQRVLENLQVYRLRLGDRDQAFKLSRDLKR